MKDMKSLEIIGLSVFVCLLACFVRVKATLFWAFMCMSINISTYYLHLY